MLQTFSLLNINPSELFLNVLQPPLPWQKVQGTRVSVSQPRVDPQTRLAQTWAGRLLPPPPAVPRHPPSQEGPASRTLQYGQPSGDRTLTTEEVIFLTHVPLEGGSAPPLTSTPAQKF